MKTFKKFLNAKTRSPEEIAKHHRVDAKEIQKQLVKGIKVELEHTKYRSIAMEIALDHLWEVPNYYDKLDKVEAS